MKKWSMKRGLPMKIAVISDTHFGFALDGERGQDSFDAGLEAVEKICAMGCDLVLMAGDIFDARVPNTRVLAESMHILSALLMKKSDVRLASVVNGNHVSKLAMHGTPIVAIHGTHERRSRDMVNQIEMLAKPGLLIHLDRSGVVFEKDGVRVAVQGLSGVPDSFARDALKEWDPKPVPGCVNILMIHQSIAPYINAPDTTLTLDDMPKGFDIIVEGHIHWSDTKKINGSTFFIPGSTVATQLNKAEARCKKGFWVLDTDGMGLKFVSLDSSRDVYYFDVDYSGKLNESIRNLLHPIKTDGKKPLVCVKVRGKIPAGAKNDFTPIEQEFGQKMMLKIDDSDLAEESAESKIAMLNELREQRLSIEEMGMKMLRRKLEESGFRGGFDAEMMYSMLADGAVEQAMAIVLGTQKTLGGFR